jgi:catechol-2,3-dioxygenase
MKRFYAGTIGFPVVDESERSITFRSGTGRLTFEHAPDAPACYHFAFDIPQNRILAAHAWQRERTDFILPPERLNDPGLPREVVAFRRWNAHSVFFWDPAGNAVEYIARHDLDNDGPDDRPFSLAEILHLSEIGLVVDDVPAAAKTVKEALGIETYVSASSAFEPVGDQHGLLLMMKTGHPMAFDQGCRRGIHATEVRLRRRRPVHVALEGYPYRLFAEPVPAGSAAPGPEEARPPDPRTDAPKP